MNQKPVITVHEPDVKYPLSDIYCEDHAGKFFEGSAGGIFLATREAWVGIIGDGTSFAPYTFTGALMNVREVKLVGIEIQA